MWELLLHFITYPPTIINLVIIMDRQILILILLLPLLSPQTLNIVPTNLAINAITNYTWSITFPNSTPRTSITLTFPSQITFLTPSIYIGSILTAAASSTSTSFTLTGLSLISSVTITVTNVKNPFSAISTTAFNFLTPLESVSNSIYNIISYTQGTLSSCVWSFSGVTEQTSSVLNITVTTANPIAAGSNRLYVNYPIKWENSNSRSLSSGLNSGAPLACAFVGFSSTITSCTVTSLLQITIVYTSTVLIPSGSLLTVAILGINNPPTQETVSTNSFKFTTTDSNGFPIDSNDYCTINPVLITTFTDGVFSTSSNIVSSIYTNPGITFTQTMPITFETGDNLVVSFTGLTLSSCTNKIYLVRNSAILFVLNSPNTNTRTYTCNNDNTDYSYTFSVSLDCSIQMPPSATPVILLYTFYRANSPYLILSAPLISTPAILSSSTAMSLSSTEMVQSAVYTFNILNTYALSATPSILVSFPPSCGFTVPTCTTFINNVLTSSTCQVATSVLTSSVLTVLINGVVPALATVIVKVADVANPPSPMVYSFGITTYYNSSLGDSQVETGSTMALFTVANIPAVLSPSTYSVFITTPFTITLAMSVSLPASSTFEIRFPIAVYQVIFFSLSVNAVPQAVTSLAYPTPTTYISVTFVCPSAISQSSTLVVSLSMKTPSVVGNYSSIQVLISNSGTAYMQSVSSMPIYVTNSSMVQFMVMPNVSVTGVYTSYEISMIAFIPHPASFFLQVTIPSDSSYLSTYNGVTGLCSGNCSGGILQTGASLLTITAVNQSPNNLGTITLTFVISFIKNPRATGASLPWQFTSTTTTLLPIAYGSVSTTIASANQLTAQLSPADPYYNSNPSPVTIYLTLYNPLAAGDYILIFIPSTAYTVVGSFGCQLFYETCTISPLSTPSTLIVNAVPTPYSLGTTSVTVIIQGLVSYSLNTYIDVRYLNIYTFNSLTKSIDAGTASYQLGCITGAAFLNHCRTCFPNGSCIDCYVANGYVLTASSTCTSSCSTDTAYLSYSNATSGTCTACVNSCRTCQSATYCITCTNATTMYLYRNMTCNPSCNLTGGFLAYTDANRQLICAPCANAQCLQCTSIQPSACVLCGFSSILDSGNCLSSCTQPNTYVANNVCTACDGSCVGCAVISTNCTTCSFNYYRSGAFCVRTCPINTVPLANFTCGCQGNCSACVNTSTTCLVCSNLSLFVFLGSCWSACPAASYLSGSSNCVPCSAGCNNCSSSTCYQCDSLNYLFRNKCYSDCHLVSPQHDNSNGFCVLCPTGCSTCNGSICRTCLRDYTLAAPNCVLTCSLTDSCTVDTQSILPLPGAITAVIWGAVVLVVKFIHPVTYLPYSFILMTSVIQTLLVIVTIGTVSHLSITVRLLLSSYSYRLTIEVLLYVYLAVNYLLNAVHVIIYLRYVKPLISNPRQIDVIANTALLVVATLTNFRLSLMAFSKMFPKPSISIDIPSKLTPLHYLCILASIFDVLIVAAAAQLIYHQYFPSNQFMLGVDLLIIVILNVGLTVWMTAIKKSDQYYHPEVKKYSLEDNHKTQEKIYQDASKENMHKQVDDLENHLGEIIFLEESQLEQPFTPSHVSQIKSRIQGPSMNKMQGPSMNKMQGASMSKMQGASMSKQIIIKAAVGKTPAVDQEGIQDTGLKRKKLNDPIDFMKELNLEQASDDIPDLETSSNANQNGKIYPDPNAILNRKLHRGSSVFTTKDRPIKVKRMATGKELTQDGEFTNQRGPTKQREFTKQRGSTKQRGFTKEKDFFLRDNQFSHGNQGPFNSFETDACESNADEMTLEAIVKSKIVHTKSRSNKEGFLSGNEAFFEQISPSKFNFQNQRYDFSDEQC